MSDLYLDIINNFVVKGVSSGVLITFIIFMVSYLIEKIISLFKTFTKW